MTSPAEPLVIFTPSGRRGRFAGGDDGPRRRPLPRRRHRLGLRRARDLRPLPGRAERRQLPEARHRVAAGAPLAVRRRRGASTAPTRASPPAAACRCTAHVLGDVVVDVPPESQVHRQVVRKGLDVRDFDIDPVVRLHYVEVEPPELASPSGDLARLFGGARARVGADRPRGRPRRRSARSSRPSRRATTRSRSRSTTAATITGVWPGLHDRAYGVAIDVGSTTIAGHLADLADGVGPREPRRDEPADPLRRGPDEPRLATR